MDRARRNGRGMVSWRSIPCVRGPGFSGHGVVWFHSWYVLYVLPLRAYSDSYGLERLRRLDQHQGFVKGVCWDPVGEFLATCSDDRSVKIWRTTDWSLEAEVKKPFEDSPGSTFFRRLRCVIINNFRILVLMQLSQLVPRRCAHHRVQRHKQQRIRIHRCSYHSQHMDVRNQPSRA